MPMYDGDSWQRLLWWMFAVAVSDLLYPYDQRKNMLKSKATNLDRPSSQASRDRVMKVRSRKRFDRR